MVNKQLAIEFDDEHLEYHMFLMDRVSPMFTQSRQRKLHDITIDNLLYHHYFSIVLNHSQHNELNQHANFMYPMDTTGNYLTEKEYHP